MNKILRWVNHETNFAVCTWDSRNQEWAFSFYVEETEPVNRLSEIVGKWPGDKSAEEIIEGVKGEPQTNEGWVSGEELEKNHKEKYNFPPEPQTNEEVTAANKYIEKKNFESWKDELRDCFIAGVNWKETQLSIGQPIYIENIRDIIELKVHALGGGIEGQKEASKEIHQQFIEPLQKQVKELTYKADAYDSVLSIFKIPEGQVIGYIKNNQEKISSLQSEIERLKK